MVSIHQNNTVKSQAVDLAGLLLNFELFWPKVPYINSLKSQKCATNQDRVLPPTLLDHPTVGQSYHHPIVPPYYIEDFRILRGLKKCRKFEVCLFVERQKIDVKDKISFPYLRMILHLLLQFFSSNNPQNISSIWCSFSKQLISCRTKKWNLFSCQSCNTFFNKELDINVLRQEQHCNQIGKT